MIYDLFIISSGGIALYHKPFAYSTIDEHLLSGFLTAISDFSKETMGEKLSKIDVKSEQLVVHFDRTMSITLAALASQKDNTELIRKFLMELAEEFYLKFKSEIRDMEGGAEITKIRDAFDPIVDRLVEKKVKKRGLLRDFLALNVGGIILFVFSFAMAYFLRSILGNYFDPSTGTRLLNIISFVFVTIRLQFFLLIGLIPAALSIGYISGRAKRKQALLMTIILIGTFLFMNASLYLYATFSGRFSFGILTQNTFTISLTIICYAPLYLLASFFFIYSGGLLMERKYMYPVPSHKLHSFNSRSKPNELDTHHDFSLTR